MKKLCLLFFYSAMLFCGTLHAQPGTEERFKVALFVPLYLDSAFDNTNAYKYGKSFPKQSIAGLEFFTGAEYAIDSLKMSNEALDFYVFDLRSKQGNINTINKSPLMDSIDLIIGQVSGSDYLRLSEIAKERAIPFISATYPNDGGVKENPFVVIVNSKLNTHIQSVYNYVARNWGPDNIVYVRSKNPADDRIEDLIRQLNQSSGGGVLKYKTVTVADYPMVTDLRKVLDSNRQNIVIAGSLSETFGTRLATACLGMGTSYKINLVGMPTWEGNKELTRSDYRPLPIIYSSTFFVTDTAWGSRFEENYRKKTFSKPSDLVYRGYEITHLFTRLLLKYDTAVIDHLDDKSFKLLTDYDFKPIRWSKTSTEPDYYENKRVYILRRLNGITEKLN
ncbi:ABC transporter substrate-binding protein [Pollutibacter soli]|uniref:ABC transporter substrate-binding protein n=1 Tax=Pollutibacter soli TaxID=3034157 RepID=UPI0030139731